MPGKKWRGRTKIITLKKDDLEALRKAGFLEDSEFREKLAGHLKRGDIILEGKI